jgi:hypothetical protein
MANSTKDSKAFQVYARVFSPGKSYSMEVDEVYKPNNLRDIKSRVEPLAGAQTVTEWAKGVTPSAHPHGYTYIPASLAHQSQ